MAAIARVTRTIARVKFRTRRRAGGRVSIRMPTTRRPASSTAHRAAGSERGSSSRGPARPAEEVPEIEAVPERGAVEDELGAREPPIRSPPVPGGRSPDRRSRCRRSRRWRRRFRTIDRASSGRRRPEVRREVSDAVDRGEPRCRAAYGGGPALEVAHAGSANDEGSDAERRTHRVPVGIEAVARQRQAEMVVVEAAPAPKIVAWLHHSLRPRLNPANI